MAGSRWSHRTKRSCFEVKLQAQSITGNYIEAGRILLELGMSPSPQLQSIAYGPGPTSPSRAKLSTAHDGTGARFYTREMFAPAC